MNWTPKLVKKYRDKDKLIFLVNYENGNIDDSFTIEYKAKSLSDIIPSIRQKIIELNALDPTSASLGVIDTTDNTPAPTPGELAKLDWIKRYNKWQRIKKMIDVGVITGNEASVVDFLNQLKSDFQPSYINDI